MKQLHIAGLPQWLVVTVTDGVKREVQTGSACKDRLRRSLTDSADRVTVIPVMVHEDWSDM